MVISGPEGGNRHMYLDQLKQFWNNLVFNMQLQYTMVNVLGRGILHGKF